MTHICYSEAYDLTIISSAQADSSLRPPLIYSQ